MTGADAPGALPGIAQLRAWLVQWVSDLDGGDRAAGPVDPDGPLDALGISSRDAVALAGDLEELLDRVVSPTLAWEAGSLTELAVLLCGEPAAHPAPRVPPDVTESSAVDDRIALVGVGCRFPGASGAAQFWQLLRDGTDAIGTVPDGRWDSFVDSTDPGLPGLTRAGGFLDDVTGFDAEHFGISPAEATLLDPQHRLLMEVAVEALEHAGVEPADLRGSDAGVFVGISVSEYAHLTAGVLSDIEGWTATGSALSMAANRLSYSFDLHGPSLALDTACSSSLVALHLACRSLQRGESSLALVGGVSLLLSPALTASFDRAGALAADGRCKTFSAAADGIGRGEGCGVVVLKRLAAAERDGDRVLAVVAGTAVNSDGRSNGLTAPNRRAQEAVLRAAYRDARVDPATVDYVEAHGTGTPLGDPIETGALLAVLGAGRGSAGPLLLGSVKTNIGHLEAAAGIAGVIKVALALSAGRLPPSLHADPPGQYLAAESGRLRVVRGDTAWPRNGGVARAGVSAFGFGGTNAHVVLEQPPAHPARPTDAPDGVHLLALSGSSEARLRRAAAGLADWLADGPGRDLPLEDVAYTLARQRSSGPVRAALTGRDRSEVVSGLRALAAQAPVTTARPGQSAGPVFVFSGYGSQWPGMGRELLRTEPHFAAAIDELAPLVQRACGLALRPMLEAGSAPVGVADSQVLLFAVQIGLTALWRSLGVLPAAVVGFSMGEVAAAVAAGVIDLPAGVRLMVTRSRLLAGVDAAGGGAMAVVDLTPDEVAQHRAGPDVQVAVYSSPGRCTVTGPGAQVALLVERAEQLGRGAWLLPVTGAGHSSAVDPILDELHAAIADLPHRRPDVPFYSTVSDDPAAPGALGPDYWVANVRRPVRFSAAVAAAARDGFTRFLEVAPHPIAAAAVRATLAAEGLAPEDVLVAGTLRRDASDAGTVAGNVGLLHAHGHPGVLLARSRAGRVVHLPATPWLHRPFWFRSQPAPPGGTGRRTGGLLPGEVDALGAHVELPEGGRHLWVTAEPEGPLTPSRVAELAMLAGRQVLGGDPGTPDLRLLDGPVGRHLVLTSLTLTGPGTANLAVYRQAGGWQIAATATLVRAAGPPADPTESPILGRLRAVVGRLMGHRPEELDVSVSLTDLGLDSLTATRARNAVEAELGVTLPVRLLLQGPSLRELADHLQAELSPGRASVTALPEPRREVQIAPRDPAERLLVGLWREALGRPVGVTELLPAAGADHGAADAVVAALTRRLGRAPDAAGLLAARTIEAMADLVRGDLEGNDDRVLRVLRGTGRRRPLWVFHPAGGPTTVYQPIVDLLPGDQPVYGLERLPDAATVESKVTRYLETIRQVQPIGPYRLLGWSLGGLLAGEAAHQLVALGEQVELLASIDTVLPKVDPDENLADLLAGRYARFADHIAQTYGQTLHLPEGLTDHDEDTQVTLLLQALTASGIRLPAGVLAHQHSSYVDARVAERYTPRPWHGPMVLYRAEQAESLTTGIDPRYSRTDETLGWDATVRDLEVVRIPGDHISMIDPPHVQVLVRHLESRLAALSEDLVP